MIRQVLRWVATIVLQLALSLLFGLLIPFQMNEWTGAETLWMLPIGLVLGSWIGGWLVWPPTQHQRWMCLLGSSAACIVLILFMLIGIFGERPPYAWILLFPVAGFDAVALWYHLRQQPQA